MSVHTAVARHMFRLYSTYRLATVAGGVTNVVFGFVRAYVLTALWRARPHLGGYDLTDALTFVFVGQALIVAVGAFGPPLELSERVRSGDVAVDLHRPVDLQAWWLAADLGRAGFQFLGRSLPIFAVGAASFTLRLSGSPVAWVAGAVSVLLAVVVGFAIRYLCALSAFWLVDDRGVHAMVFAAGPFFAGLVLPLALFPGWFGTLARALPWSATLQVPADVLMGRYPGWHALAALGFQAGWAAVLLVAGRLVTGAGRRRVVVQGG